MQVLVILLHLTLVVVIWYVLAHQVKHDMEVATLVSKDTYMGLLSNIKDGASSLLPINLSALGFARILNSSLNGTLPSFSIIEDQVARNLFLAFSIVPHLSQSSYVGESGLLYAYYKEKNQSFALFVNSSDTSSNSKFNHWYRQSVNDDTGMRFGQAIEIAPLILPPSSYYNANQNGYASWELGIGENKEPLFTYIAPINKFLPQGQRGIISLGVQVKVFTNFISNMDLYNGYVFSATEDGHSLIQTGPPNATITFSSDMLLVQLEKSKDNALATTTIHLPCKLNSSNMNDNLLIASDVNIWDTRYEFYCTSVEIGGIRSVVVLIIPDRGYPSLLHNKCIIALILLLLMFILILPTSCYYIFLHIRATRREILLSAALIKQMEATQQAERKSMNKSIAFASASHDVRTSLAAIAGLIDLSLSSVSPQEEIHTNLEQMSSCASNLLGILNSVLDTSKIEAGKMQLEEEEFDLAQVLEEAVEIFYTVALKKGLDVMLDPCDGSVLKYSHVIGDCGRLKQILHNLLNNAVKFTSEGRIVVRAWVKKSSLENSYRASDRGGCFTNLRTCISNLKNGDTSNDLGSIYTTQQNSDSIEFIVEVDDTGKGIPKENHKSVFENYVQVKESGAEGHQGTGLGLGIVQSLVRLMGGEIMIIDKEYGEKGTCFKFHVFLHAHETSDSDIVVEDIRLHKDQVSNSKPYKAKSHLLLKDIRLEYLHAILLVQSKEGSLILQRWMEHHGIKVWPINQWNQLYSTLEKIKHKMFVSHSSTSRKFGSTSLRSYLVDSVTQYSNEPEKDDHSLSSTAIMRDLNKNTSHNGEPNCVLIIIDISCGYFSETCSTLACLSKATDDLLHKIVWMVDPKIPRADLQRLENKHAPCDLILQKPFHRSHLYAIIQLFQKNGNTVEGHSNLMLNAQGSVKLNQLKGQSKEHNARPLSGINILVAEDNVVLQRLAVTTLSSLGAKVECCENGKDAVNVIRKALQGINEMHNGSHFNEEAPGLSKRFSYDLVLMDCEMPIMNGYEATIQIRIEERQYGIHIPIIALTAHAMAEEATKSLQAGMDFHLVKPLTAYGLLEVIHSIKSDN
eukprot:TRINITY_DN1422_c1_g1_i1.p1 TRINITY_DN1422_c1_g1~~TRINITY_DN1422_c1_g1_i1.p1  ORF type:complete len:1080 (-),score=145.71 TRINITY_DN1422_c1_g1_i1:181-3420(-)